jgi:hypothetical protein
MLVLLYCFGTLSKKIVQKTVGQTVTVSTLIVHTDTIIAVLISLLDDHTPVYTSSTKSSTLNFNIVFCYMSNVFILTKLNFLLQEIYSVKLPGNPKLGEGKPENQNHAVIFTRGNAVQTIDMNQVSSYLHASFFSYLLSFFFWERLHGYWLALLRIYLIHF